MRGPDGFLASCLPLLCQGKTLTGPNGSGIPKPSTWELPDPSQKAAPPAPGGEFQAGAAPASPGAPKIPTPPALLGNQPPGSSRGHSLPRRYFKKAEKALKKKPNSCQGASQGRCESLPDKFCARIQPCSPPKPPGPPLGAGASLAPHVAAIRLRLCPGHLLARGEARGVPGHCHKVLSRGAKNKHRQK